MPHKTLCPQRRVLLEQLTVVYRKDGNQRPALSPETSNTTRVCGKGKDEDLEWLTKAAWGSFRPFSDKSNAADVPSMEPRPNSREDMSKC
ncbi:hypothetical protein GN956_G13210 [Arapaima gigas]